MESEIESQSKKSIKEKIMAAVKSGELVMRPRWHFVLRAALLVLGVVITLLVLIYLASFILFILRASGIIFIPFFGGRGLFASLFSLPWFLIMLVILFIIVLELLVKKYSFSYRRPLLYSAISIIAIVVLGSLAVSRIALHERLFRDARHGHLPFAGGFYRNFGAPRLGNIHRGEIVQMMPNGFILNDLRDETSTIVVAPETRVFPIEKLEVGDEVIIFGENNAGVIRAEGIREIEKE